MATTTPRPLAGVRPLITTAEVCDFAPGEGSADAAGELGPGRRPRRRPHGARRGGPDRAPVLRPQRERLRVDGGARVVVPRELRRPRAGARRAAAARLPRARHLRHGVPQRRGARAPREHVPRGRRSTSPSWCRGENSLAIRFDPPLQHAQAARPRAVVEHARRARVDAQGAVRLRLGLGPAAAHDRDLAPGRAAARAHRDAHARELLDARDRARGARGGRRRGRARSAATAGSWRRSSCARRGGGRAATAREPVTLRDGAARPRYLTLDDPPLWWTHDLGEPALHDLRVTLQQRRRGRRRARAPRRRAHARARPAARPRRAGHALLPLRAQRRRHLRPRRELDPGRLVRRRARVGALRAADRGRASTRT